MEFKKYKLEDVCLKITDGSHYSPKNDENSKIPMLSVKDMLAYDFDYKDCKHISEEEYNKMKRNDCVPKIGDVLVAKDGSYLKEIFVNKRDDKKAILSSIAIFRPNINIILPEYLCYLLKSPKVHNYTRNNCVSGSALPRIILKSFKNIPIEITTIENQAKIVNFLSSLDKKIQLNTQINNNLYEIVIQMYNNLFLNVEKWKELKLEEIGNISSGKRPKIKLEKGMYPLIGANGKMGYTSEYNFDKDIIITGRVGTLGVVKRYYKKIWASDNTLIIETKYKNYIENYLKTLDYSSLNRGSTQPLLTQTDLKNQKILFNDGIVSDFEFKAEKFVNKIRNNEEENEKLEQLRDKLLPKLLNGEINLDKVEI